MEPPDPPDSIPAYLRDGIDRQDRTTLAAIAEYCERRMEFLQRDVETDALADDDEELVAVDESTGGTIVVKRVPCGKDCSGCPHGPYKYRVTRDGTTLDWEYLGPVNE